MDVTDMETATATTDFTIHGVPQELIYGDTEELNQFGIHVLIIARYLQNKISMVKAGELLGLKDYDAVCDYFHKFGVPTKKNYPPDIRRELKTNQKEIEQELGI